MSALLSFGFGYIHKILNKLSRITAKLSNKFDSQQRLGRGVVASTKYDMVTSAGESYYADQYWHVLDPHLKLLPSEAKFLDLGCGQGRFALKLARRFPRGLVLACDLSAEAIEQAKQYASSHNFQNIHFAFQSIHDFLQTQSSRSVDAIMMTEVTFFYPQWKEDMFRFMQILKPGGIVIISFRSQYYDALWMARRKQFENVERLLNDRRGAILGSSTEYTWQQSHEIRQILSEEFKLEILEMFGVGACSGITGDPHDYCKPDDLSKAERDLLMNLELAIGKSVPDGGRYILAIARKTKCD